MKEFSYIDKHMGTEVSLSFVCNTKGQADSLANDIFSIIRKYELMFSRFLPKSELSLINQNGGGMVSKEFVSVLERSLELTHITNGAFNPLVQVSSLGYKANYPDLTNEVLLENEAYNTNIEDIVIDKISKHITLGQNQKLDFGGILKGYLADQLADQIITERTECHGCVINIGGDLATRGFDELGKPFTFLLFNPITGAETSIVVTNAALATSGTYTRRWQTNLGIKHHIVDSNNYKNPTVDCIAVSIISKNGALSEALTKLFITRGESVATATISPIQHGYQYFYVQNSGDVKSNIV